MMGTSVCVGKNLINGDEGGGTYAFSKLLERLV